MYLKVGGKLRPFNEASASIRYEPQYDLRRRIISIRERWDIRGRVVLQANATESRMTQALAILDQDFSQPTPDLVFIEDNQSTPTFYQLRAADCLDGPNIVASSFPGDGADIYPTGNAYEITFEAEKSVPGAGGDVIVEFEEQLQQLQGGTEYDFVGGAINYAELQITRQHAPYKYRQVGRAVGLYGYPQAPGPLWPLNQLRTNLPTYRTPREYGRVPRYFETRWDYLFGSVFPLVGRPHTLT